MVNLYLGDLRDCPEGFIVARTFEDAIKVFRKYRIDVLSLDHDLGEDEHGNELKNGYDIVKYFYENGLRANKIYLHTDNPVGRKNMYDTLLAAQRRGFIDEDIEIYHYPIAPNKYSVIFQNKSENGARAAPLLLFHNLLEFETTVVKIAVYLRIR